MTTWPEVALGEVVNLTSGFAFKSKDYVTDESAIRLLRGDNIGQGFLRWEDAKRLPADQRGEHAAYELAEHDVVLAMDRPWISAGLKFASVTRRDLPSLLVQRVARLRGGDRVEQRFLRHVIGDPAFTGYVQGITTGANVPHISGPDIRKYRFPIPPLPTQRRIASILSAYDDLIENNTTRIEILEEMARSLYREWFVHFRFPGHEKVRLVDSELGKIPEGWRVKPLDEVAFCRLGKMLDKEKNKGELRPYLGNVNVRWGEFEFDALKEMRFEPLEYDKYGLKYGDIVMCEGGEPGRCALWKEQVPGMMIQKALHRIRANSGIDFVFLYQSLLDEAQSGRLFGLFTGATIKHLPGEKLAKVQLRIPSGPLMQSFTRFVEPMERQTLVLQQKNRVLRQTRDLLLPKLISGEIDVDALDLPEAS